MSWLELQQPGEPHPYIFIIHNLSFPVLTASFSYRFSQQMFYIPGISNFLDSPLQIHYQCITEPCLQRLRSYYVLPYLQGFHCSLGRNDMRLKACKARLHRQCKVYHQLQWWLLSSPWTKAVTSLNTWVAECPVVTHLETSPWSCASSLPHSLLKGVFVEEFTL